MLTATVFAFADTVAERVLPAEQSNVIVRSQLKQVIGPSVRSPAGSDRQSSIAVWSVSDDNDQLVTVDEMVTPAINQPAAPEKMLKGARKKKKVSIKHHVKRAPKQAKVTINCASDSTGDNAAASTSASNPRTK